MESSPSDPKIQAIVAKGLTTLQVFEKAAVHKGLPWNQTELPVKIIPIGTRSLSESIFEILKRDHGYHSREIVNFIPPHLIALATQDLSQQPATFSPADEEAREWFWFFRIDQVALVTIYADPWIAKDETGVVLKLWLEANWQSPHDREEHYRLFKALRAIGADLGRFNALADQFIVSGGQVFVSWSDLGLNDLISISGLFRQFAGEDLFQLLWGLAKSPINPFKPEPFQSSGIETHLWFLPEQSLDILPLWRRQLNDFCTKLQKF